jgi:hypothetical protein
MTSKRKPQFVDPLEAAKVAAFEAPDSGEEEIPVEVDDAPSGPPMPVVLPPQPKYRLLADTKVFMPGKTVLVRKDKVLSAEDGPALLKALFDMQAPLEMIE